jgi:hypothetical protein
MLSAAILLFFMSGAASSQEKQNVIEINGVEALAELLKDRGVITPQDAAAFKQAYHKEKTDQGLTALVELLKEKKILKAEDAANFVQRYGGKPLGEAGAKGVSIAADVRNKEYIEKVTTSAAQEIRKDLREQVHKEVREEVAREVKKEQATFAKAVPEWTKRIRWGGDIRLRYENDRFDKNNAPDVFKPSDPTSLMNTTVDKNVYRYRVRLEVAAKVNDATDATFRLATGNETNPVSTNTALGNNLNKDKFLLDLAYLKTQPWKPFTLYAGRMPNPWFSSDLVWDRDLGFDGVALNLQKTFKESWTPFLTVGAFPLQEVEYSSTMKYLMAAQVGLEKKSERGVGFKLGMAYYDFHNITGVLNEYNSTMKDWTAPGYQQKGNTLFDISNTPGATSKLAYASEFKEWNVTAALDINFWNPYRITFLADYVKNIGHDLAEVRGRAGPDVPSQDAKGYQFGMTVGYPEVRDFAQWRLALHYKYLEADAVVDAYTDSDFHLGGTNAKGWIMGAEFGLMKNVWLAFRWFTANEIVGAPLAIDVFQADVNARF